MHIRPSSALRNDYTGISELAGPQSARKIYATMRDTINALRQYPLMGPVHPDPLLASQGFRKLVLAKTYAAVYKLIDGTVTVCRIVNGGTDYPRLLRE